jgi:hypothetical protein
LAVPNGPRRRTLVLCVAATLVGSGLVGAVQLSNAPRADASNCRRTESCGQWIPKLSHPTVTRPRTFTRLPDTTVPISAPTVTVQPVRALAAAPTTCAEVVGAVVWPPAWRVRCAGPRTGLLGATEHTRVTTLFVRTNEAMTQLRVVALHEAGHAWDFARLDAARIARWCAARGCDSAHFFSDAVYRQPLGAEDWAASWDACHGGEYHRSYLGLAAPSPAQCVLQDVLVDYPSRGYGASRSVVTKSR